MLPSGKAIDTLYENSLFFKNKKIHGQATFKEHPDIRNLIFNLTKEFLKSYKMKKKT